MYSTPSVAVVTVAVTAFGFFSVFEGVCFPVDVAKPYEKLSKVRLGVFATAFAAVTAPIVIVVPTSTSGVLVQFCVDVGADNVEVSVPYDAVAAGFGHFSTQASAEINSCNEMPAGITPLV